jgi:Flp pilus assembly pilin Flp
MAALQMARRWMTAVTDRLSRRSERAASLVEYALLVALIAVVMVGAVTTLGEATSGSLDRSANSIIDASP